MSLEITEIKEKKMGELEDVSMDVVLEYLKGKRQGGDDVVTARCMINAMKGNRQTLTAKEALRFNMASSVASEAQLKRYVSATCPQIKKLLT